MSHRRPQPPAAAPGDRSDATALAARAAADRVRAALPRDAGRCRLRPARSADVADLQAYRGLPEVTRFLGHPPVDAEGMAQLLDGWVADLTAVTVVAELDGRVVGDVRLTVLPCHALAPAATDEVEARVGYAFHPAVGGRGLATAAVGTVVDLALAEGGVRRVTARVFAAARPSSRLLARLGFHLDGVDRAAVLAPDGSGWWDDECWSLLRGDRGPGTVPGPG
ncbi:GNAT family N-acetyltransferase [Ornithinimicrobium pekingense]|uniref:N-acetyltransferase domain-containing protein n=1 Tax=Ornithinimicrobium pekingense TaxID=384677 RepID=A0ABQ2FB90_9MICO|nr:GNAT family protein [Ornithinimicrobium pekingense]GGK70681.1 hypothetical protein GCM10011509_18930 [Ornithinimicrobium pekingense]